MRYKPSIATYNVRGALTQCAYMFLCISIGGLPIQIYVSSGFQDVTVVPLDSFINSTDSTISSRLSPTSETSDNTHSSTKAYIQTLQAVLNSMYECTLRIKRYPEVEMFIRCPSGGAFETLVGAYLDGEVQTHVDTQLPASFNETNGFINDFQIREIDMTAYRDLHLAVQGK